MSMKKDKEKKQEPDKEEAQNRENAARPVKARRKANSHPHGDAPADDVEKLKAEASEHLENWKRKRADFVNYKKLIEREEKNLRANMKIELIKKYLPVLDDMELALKALPEDSKDKAWFSGIDLIFKKLQKILESEGVVEIFADEFDPTRQEAITYEPCPGHQSGEIIEVVKKGYMLGDRVLRPAQVRVAQ